MSLSDIVQFVGTSSVPVVIAGTVLGVFELGEKLASQRAKDALSKWLLTFDLRKAGALPDGTRELFERIFGERHFSWKCFARSVAFSLGAIAFVTILSLLINPEGVQGILSSVYYGSGRLSLALWLPWSVFVDYLSLLKTRVILEIMTQIRRRNMLIAIPIVGLDYIIYKIIFAFGFASIFMSMPYGVFEDFDLEFVFNVLLAPFTDPADAIFILFWAGFAPSIWMWLYVAALLVTRAILRSERVVNWLRWFLDVEKNPFRSIGAVAAALAFIASVAIIFISAEVSRISAAA